MLFAVRSLLVWTESDLTGEVSTQYYNISDRNGEMASVACLVTVRSHRETLYVTIEKQLLTVT